jgi:uncharacterized protein (TIGR01777 family)
MTLSAPKVVAITGASGLVGTALAKHLKAAGAEVRPFVRGAASGRGEAAQGSIAWDPATGEIDAAALEGVDAVVNLAGESVVGLWTEAKKQRIRESRVSSTALVAKAMAGLRRRPAVLVSASAIGFYPDVGDGVLDESAAPGDGFLSSVCTDWEAATKPAEDAGIRVARLRIGIVLAKEGGALEKMAMPFRLGVGGPLGSGKQYVSWIAMDDLLAAFSMALADDTLRGAVNAVAPNPVTNAELSKTLGAVLHRPSFMPAPAFAIRAALGEFSTEVLSSHRIAPKRLTDAGFVWKHASLESALRAALL